MSPCSTLDRLPPVHPGEVLRDALLRPLGLYDRALAERIGAPPNRVSAIAADKRGITGDTVLRFGAAFGTTPEFWMNLEKNWELTVTRVVPHLSNARHSLELLSYLRQYFPPFRYLNI